MARFRKAVWRPVTRFLPGGSSHSTMGAPARLVYHTAVTTSSSLHASMQGGNATSHFFVAEDGTIEQYVDTGVRATAHTSPGNDDCITVETWDGLSPTDTADPGPAWTPGQVDSLARLAAWCNRVHGIPLVRLPSSFPGTRGIGWHRLGIDGNFPGGLLAGRVAGGEHWSSSFGKLCPTETRIKQVVDDVIPLARRLATGGPVMARSTPVEEEPEMDRDELLEIVREAVREELSSVQFQDPDQPQVTRSLVGLLRDIDKSLRGTVVGGPPGG